MNNRIIELRKQRDSLPPWNPLSDATLLVRHLSIAGDLIDEYALSYRPETAPEVEPEGQGLASCPFCGGKAEQEYSRHAGEFVDLVRGRERHVHSHVQPCP